MRPTLPGPAFSYHPEWGQILNSHFFQGLWGQSLQERRILDLTPRMVKKLILQDLTPSLEKTVNSRSDPTPSVTVPPADSAALRSNSACASSVSARFSPGGKLVPVLIGPSELLSVRGKHAGMDGWGPRQRVRALTQICSLPAPADRTGAEGAIRADGEDECTLACVALRVADKI